MNIYLQQFSLELAEDVHAVLVWDQAGFHKSKELKIPDNITIIPLPAYSPELNPFDYAQGRLCGESVALFS